MQRWGMPPAIVLPVKNPAHLHHLSPVLPAAVLIAVVPAVAVAAVAAAREPAVLREAAATPAAPVLRAAPAVQQHQLPEESWEECCYC